MLWFGQCKKLKHKRLLKSLKKRILSRTEGEDETGDALSTKRLLDLELKKRNLIRINSNRFKLKASLRERNCPMGNEDCIVKTHHPMLSIRYLDNVGHHPTLQKIICRSD